MTATTSHSWSLSPPSIAYDCWYSFRCSSSPSVRLYRQLPQTTTTSYTLPMHPKVYHYHYLRWFSTAITTIASINIPPSPTAYQYSLPQSTTMQSITKSTGTSNRPSTPLPPFLTIHQHHLLNSATTSLHKSSAPPPTVHNHLHHFPVTFTNSWHRSPPPPTLRHQLLTQSSTSTSWKNPVTTASYRLPTA